MLAEEVEFGGVGVGAVGTAVIAVGKGGEDEVLEADVKGVFGGVGVATGMVC